MSSEANAAPGPGRPLQAWINRDEWYQYLRWDEESSRYERAAFPMPFPGMTENGMRRVLAEDGNASLAESVVADEDLTRLTDMMVQFDNNHWLTLEREPTKLHDWRWEVMRPAVGDSEGEFETVADGRFTVDDSSKKVETFGSEFVAVHNAMTAAAAWFTRTVEGESTRTETRLTNDT